MMARRIEPPDSRIVTLPLVVVIAEVKNRVVVDQRHTKFLEPALAAEHVAANLNCGGKEHDGIELPIKAGDRYFVAEGLKLAIGGSKEGWSATLDVEPELLAVHSVEDTIVGSRIELGEKPNRFSARRQFDWNCNSRSTLGAVVVGVPECESGRQIYHPAKGICSWGSTRVTSGVASWRAMAAYTSRAESPTASSALPSSATQRPAYCSRLVSNQLSSRSSRSIPLATSPSALKGEEDACCSSKV